MMVSLSSAIITQFYSEGLTATCAATFGIPNLVNLNWRPKNSSYWPSYITRRCNRKELKKGKRIPPTPEKVATWLDS